MLILRFCSSPDDVCGDEEMRSALDDEETGTDDDHSKYYSYMCLLIPAIIYH